MIRYVLAVVLTTAILGLGLSAADYGATFKSERQVETEIATIESAAVSLIEDEEIPQDGQDGPRRFVDIDLPDEGLVEKNVERFEFQQLPETTRTRVTYRVGDGPQRRTYIDAPVVRASGNNLDLSGQSGSQRLVLELQRDEEGDPVVEVGT